MLAIGTFATEWKNIILQVPSNEIIRKEIILIMEALLLNHKSECIFNVKTYFKIALNMVIINIFLELNECGFLCK